MYYIVYTYTKKTTRRSCVSQCCAKYYFENTK